MNSQSTALDFTQVFIFRKTEVSRKSEPSTTNNVSQLFLMSSAQLREARSEANHLCSP